VVASDVRFLDGPGTMSADLPAEDRDDASENDALDLPL
jgi:hypothetical protein